MEKYKKEDLEEALRVLKSGGIILYPTDTVWGIGCDATNPEAVAKIYALKQREDSKSMLSLVGSESQLQQFVANVPETAWMLLDVAVNPLTIIYDKPSGLAANLFASDGSAGVRITTEPFSRQLCLRLKKPVVSTSANISGFPTPATFREISDEIKLGVDYIVNYQREDDCRHTPSNIIKVSDNETIKLIR
ncbi:MAG: L-threonylcarbamoyladenylate synthase [Candidatus Amulumruptor caecigallinarius]|nr:L-threonylcarbamoyladenylate synthase [Candidatus Amulumruptor caecigallinarius]